MKIDEKIVTYFESCTSPVDKEGYLYKKIKTSYQKRWFVLKGNLLFYKDRAADRDAIGLIVLEGCTVELCESEEQFAFSLVWSEPGLRTYKFAAEDQAGQESWIKALLSANHNYLALLVMDMEKKYRGERQKALGLFLSPGEREQPLFVESSLNKCSPAAAAGPGLSAAGPTFQMPAISSKAASNRSPKLWPKRSANVVPINTPAPPIVDWSGVCLDYTREEFCKLHEDLEEKSRN
uniref:Sesquipedalian n=1 Tax=Scophthalmus maximus TaxID=52904 RepID=A0A8D3CHT4_SCOMX